MPLELPHAIFSEIDYWLTQFYHLYLQRKMLKRLFSLRSLLASQIQLTGRHSKRYTYSFNFFLYYI